MLSLSCAMQLNHKHVFLSFLRSNLEVCGRWVEVQVFDRVASLPQVKGNLASCREREKKERKRRREQHQHSSRSLYSDTKRFALLGSLYLCGSEQNMCYFQNFQLDYTFCHLFFVPAFTQQQICICPLLRSKRSIKKHKCIYNMAFLITIERPFNKVVGQRGQKHVLTHATVMLPVSFSNNKPKLCLHVQPTYNKLLGLGDLLNFHFV